MAEVIGTALIAAFAHHPIQPARRQRREHLQRLTDERQIRIDQRLARWAAQFLAIRPAPTRAAPHRYGCAAAARSCQWSIFRRGRGAKICASISAGITLAVSCPIVSHNPSTTKTAAQKYLAAEIQTSPPAPSGSARPTATVGQSGLLRRS